MRKKKAKTTAAPTKIKNVAAKPIGNLDKFVPPVFEKDQSDVRKIQVSLEANFIFENLDDNDLDIFIKAFEKISVHKGNQIIKQGDAGDFFYIIGRGKVTFEVNGNTVGEASAGKSFGELALLYTSPRAASAIATAQPTQLYRVDQKTFRYIMQTKAKESEGEKMKLLRTISFLKDLSDDDLQRLCSCMVLRKFEADEQIVTKGEEGNDFYIVHKGSVRVTDIAVGNSTYDDVTLQPGAHFGERALVTSEPRAANVIGAEVGSCFVIDRPTFEKVLGNFSNVIMRSQDKVILEGVSTLKRARLESIAMESLASAVVEKTFKAKDVIQESKTECEAAVYLVREGSVSIQEDGQSIRRLVQAGGYFGDENLLADADGCADKSGLMTSACTIICEDDVVCGVLTLKQCRLIFDTVKAFDHPDESKMYDFRGSALIKRRSTIKEVMADNPIDMNDLEKDKLLGEGQFGEVWLVKADIWGTGEEDDIEEFALKIQSLNTGEGDDFAAAVKREKEVISSLEHPFIVDLVSAYENEEESLMLMTVVEGGELWNVVHREQDNGEWISGVPEDHARFYSLVIADTVAYMHHKHVIFRDLKPENILIDKDGYPNIIDFGFAKVVHHKTFTFCGTPQYVAPEIILSQGHTAGVDHWALGVLIYEMIAGENPFFYDGLGTSELYEIIAKEEPYPIEANVSDEVKSIIDGLLEKDPTQRLGNLKGKDRDILSHPWFSNSDLDLKLLKEKTFKAPWIPDM